MAIITADQLPRHQEARRHQQRRDLVEGRRPAADHLRARHRPLPRPATSPPPTASTRTAPRASCSAVSTSGIIFALLGFEQADQLAGESSNPKRDIPRAVIGSIVIGIDHLHRAAGRVPRARCRHRDREHLGEPAGLYTAFTGPFAAGRHPGQPRLARGDPLRRRDHLPRRHRPDLHHRQLAGLLRAAAATATSRPSFESTDQRGVPWVGLIAAFVAGCICFLPFPSWQSLVGLITSASVLMYAGAPLSLGVFRERLPDADRPYRLPAAEVLSPARLRRRQPDHPLVRAGTPTGSSASRS